MSLIDRLNDDMKQAMRNKERKKLSVIRMIRASLQNKAIELGVEQLSEDDELTILSRELKQRNDSRVEFEKADREDLVQDLDEEIEILQQYMPEQLSEEEVEQIVLETIEELNASSKKDFGKVMGQTMPKVKGQAEGSLVQQLVNKHLS